jgi:hypothetical protein
MLRTLGMNSDRTGRTRSGESFLWQRNPLSRGNQNQTEAQSDNWRAADSLPRLMGVSSGTNDCRKNRRDRLNRYANTN